MVKSGSKTVQAKHEVIAAVFVDRVCVMVSIDVSSADVFSLLRELHAMVEKACFAFFMLQSAVM